MVALRSRSVQRRATNRDAALTTCGARAAKLTFVSHLQRELSAVVTWTPQWLKMALAITMLVSLSSTSCWSVSAVLLHGRHSELPPDDGAGIEVVAACALPEAVQIDPAGRIACKAERGAGAYQRVKAQHETGGCLFVVFHARLVFHASGQTSVGRRSTTVVGIRSPFRGASVSRIACSGRRPGARQNRLTEANQLRTGTMLKLATPSAAAMSCASESGDAARVRSSATTQKRHIGWLSVKLMRRLSRSTR
jgi:hypothetical protein